MSFAAEPPASPRPPPAPRPVPGRARGWAAGFMLLFGGIWGAVGAILMVVFTAVGGPPWNDWILDRRGVRATAQLIDARATSSRVNRQRVYEVRFHFRDRGGRDWTDTASTRDPALVQSAHGGGTVPVEYDPEDPHLARFEGASSSVFGAFVLLPAAFAILGTAIFLTGMAKGRVGRRVYRDGTAVEARVTAVEATASSQNRQRVMRMTYTFDGPSGPVTGDWKTLTPAPVGTAIWVLYDPAQPERSLPAKV